MKVFCRACNELFVTAAPRCPRCGLVMSSDDELPETESWLMDRGPSGDQAEPDTLEIDRAGLESQRIHIYQCERLLGRGGMGAVYLARNLHLHRYCALKILSPKLASREYDYVARFQSEGRAAAALVHANIVTVHAIGQCDEHDFLEMEYVAGLSLQQEIDRFGALGPIRSTAMAASIASGLAAAHRLGIVHRDLKPDNVMVTPAGVPKIADFGLAKRLTGDELPTSNLAGTPYFMAPELFHGAPASPSSDVFALGVCYYLMLTGCYPFAGSSIAAVAQAIQSGEYTSVRSRNPEIPLDVAECVSLLMAAAPGHRVRDGASAAQLLQAVLGSSRDLDMLVFDAFQGLSAISCTRDGRRFRVQVKLQDHRSQTVFIENSDHAAGDRLLLIYSVCCPARPEFYEQALRLNASVHHGGLAIRDLADQPHFVMIDTYHRATVNAEEIRRSVLEVGANADRVERLLTGTDVN